MSEVTADSDAPKSYAVRTREYALRDITAAYVRIAEEQSLDIANLWRQGLLEAIATLATMPRRCPLAPEPFRREMRQLLYRRPGGQVTYRILFTITGEQEQSPDPPTVAVMHVRHGSARPITRKQIREIEANE